MVASGMYWASQDHGTSDHAWTSTRQAIVDTHARALTKLACPFQKLARDGSTTIVNNISLTVGAGEAVGIVGGSGCGKTTLARASLGLVPLTRGVVRVKGIDLHTLGSTALRRYRQHMQMVFQDPGGSLNGRMRVGQLVAEPHHGAWPCQRPRRGCHGPRSPR